jgi:hypothetical protein
MREAYLGDKRLTQIRENDALRSFELPNCIIFATLYRPRLVAI